MGVLKTPPGLVPTFPLPSKPSLLPFRPLPPLHSLLFHPLTSYPISFPPYPPPTMPTLPSLLYYPFLSRLFSPLHIPFLSLPIHVTGIPSPYLPSHPVSLTPSPPPPTSSPLPWVIFVPSVRFFLIFHGLQAHEIRGNLLHLNTGGSR